VSDTPLHKGLNIGFAGTPPLAASILNKILEEGRHRVSCVYTQPDRPAGRGKLIHKSPVKALAESFKLPLKQPHTTEELEMDETLTQLDLLVVAAFGMILTRAILEKPRHGCINVHTSLLPRWRGAAPIQHAILAGDTETGITIMQMDVGLDTGDILFQKSCEIFESDTSDSLHSRLAQLGAECLMIVLDTICNGEQQPVAQDAAQATYANKIQKSDAEVNWSQSATDITRLVRAMNPAPVAYSQIDQQQIRIWHAKVLDGDTTDIKPGTVINYGPEGLDVAAMDHPVRILQLQLPGKKVLSIQDIYNGNPLLWDTGR
jgi:methionyl-tRNA formyltransferase